MRDLPYSDCYRRSIACSRRGSHGNAVLRFFKIAINPRFDDIKKQVEQGSTCLLCGGDAGFALQRLLPKVNRVQPKGFTRQCRVAVYKIAINPRFDDIKKQVEQGSTCLLCGGDKGIRTPGLRIANATLYQLSHIPDSQIHLLCYYITLSAFGNNFLAICSADFFAATLSASFHILIGCGVKYDMCFENKISATRNEY